MGGAQTTAHYDEDEALILLISVQWTSSASPCIPEISTVLLRLSLLSHRVHIHEVATRHLNSVTGVAVTVTRTSVSGTAPA